MLGGAPNGKDIQKREDICMCVADSLCCIAETNTTLKSNYTPIKIEKIKHCILFLLKKKKAVFFKDLWLI